MIPIRAVTAKARLRPWAVLMFGGVLVAVGLSFATAIIVAAALVN